MHVLSRPRLEAFWSKHPDANASLRVWYKRVKLARWRNFDEMRAMFPSADKVKNLTVFNIGGNKHRLIVLIDYEYQKVFVRAILTHSEYNKEGWKNDSWFE